MAVRTETVRGIKYRVEFTPAGGEDSGAYVVGVDVPQGDRNLTFTALRRNFKSALLSLLTRREKIATSDSAFDRRVYLFSETQYAPMVAKFFASAENREAVQKLLGLGCIQVKMNKAGVSAMWRVPVTTARPPEPRIVMDAVPVLASLCGLRVADQAPNEAAAAIEAQVERLSDQAEMKNWEVTAALGIIPFFAPAAYLYVGGWLHGLVTLVLFIPFLFLLTTLPPPLLEATPAVFPVALWKVCVASTLRNRLVSEDGVLSSREFNSFRYAGFAAADLFLGCAMALAAGLCWIYLVKSQSDTSALIRYFVIAAPMVWLVELGLSYALHRVSWAIAGSANPFLEQQSGRWQRHANAGSLAQPGSVSFLPTWREALRAIAVSLVIPLFVELGRIRI